MLLLFTLLLAPPIPSEPEQAFHRGEYLRAAALATRQLESQPRDLSARLVLARAEAAQGHFEAAYAGFRAALQQDPRNPDALYFLSVTAGVLAQAEYERVFTLDPESARAHHLKSELFKAQGKTEEAQRELEAALGKNPRSVDTLVALGDLSRAKLAFSEATTYYTRALEIAPSSYDVLYGLGVCHAFRGEQARAVTFLREAVRADAHSASARLALGTALLQTGETLEAAKELEAAVSLEPRLRQAHYQLGRAYQALGRTPEAEAAFARVREILDLERAAQDPTLGLDPP
jgi:tetratricopeptide (TPR) repeat protein